MVYGTPMTNGTHQRDRDELSEAEIARRRDAALLRALSTPHKRQKEMKLGKARGPESRAEKTKRDK